MVQRKTDVSASQASGGISQAGAASASLAKADFANTISQIGNSVASFGVKLNEMNKAYNEAARQADNTAVYANSMNQATIEFQNAFQERISSPLDDNGNPTFSTLQQDVSQISRDVLEENLNKIEDAEVRAKFQQNFESYTTNQQVQSIGVARNQQLSFINESVSNSVAELGTMAGASSEQDMLFFQNQVKTILNSAVESGAMTPEQRFVAQDGFRKEVATAKVRNSINEDAHMALETLMNTPAPDLGLSELERLALQKEAETAVYRLDNQRNSLSKEQDRYIRDQLKQFDRIIDLGGQIPQDSIDNITDIIEGTGFEDEFVNIMNKSAAIGEFTMNTPITRQAILNQLSADENLTLPELELRRKLESIDNRLNTQINNDVYSLAIEQGIIENQTPFDPNSEIKQQLMDRISSIGFIENHYGVRSSGLTKEELNGFQEAYSNADYQTKSTMLGDVIGGLGAGSLSFLEELALNGSSQAAAIGSIMLEGDSATAVTILKGQDVLKTNRDVLAPDFMEVEFAAIENTLPFYDLPQQQEDIRQMSRAIYAAKTFEAFDFSGATDKSRLEMSIAQVSNGGAISFNRSNVEPPVNGMTSNEFKKWVRQVTVEDINSLGGWKGFDNDKLVNNLRRSQLITQGRGQYLVFLTSGDGTMRPVLNNNGDAFILDYEVVEGNAREALPQQTTEEIIANVNSNTTKIRTIR